MASPTPSTRARPQDLLRADHHLHLRCEICAARRGRGRPSACSTGIPSPDLADGPHAGPAPVPRRREAGGSTTAASTGCSRGRARPRSWQKRAPVREPTTRAHRARAGGACRARGRSSLASHDDTTLEHVAEGDRRRRRRSPSSRPRVEAAAASHAAGIAVLMGAPNVVRGGSHSGNVAAETLAREGVLDILSSDYVPASLLMGAFELARRIDGYGLAAALRTVTLHPARADGARATAARSRPACAPISCASACRMTFPWFARSTVAANACSERGSSARSLARSARGRRPRRRAERGGQGRHPPRDARTARSGSALRVPSAHRDARGQCGRGPRGRRRRRQFDALVRRGGLAVHWQAHGLDTASPAEIDRSRA